MCAHAYDRARPPLSSGRANSPKVTQGRVNSRHLTSELRTFVSFLAWLIAFGLSGYPMFISFWFWNLESSITRTQIRVHRFTDVRSQPGSVSGFEPAGDLCAKSMCSPQTNSWSSVQLHRNSGWFENLQCEHGHYRNPLFPVQTPRYGSRNLSRLVLLCFNSILRVAFHPCG